MCSLLQWTFSLPGFSDFQGCSIPEDYPPQSYMALAMGRPKTNPVRLIHDQRGTIEVGVEHVVRTAVGLATYKPH